MLAVGDSVGSGVSDEEVRGKLLVVCREVPEVGPVWCGVCETDSVGEECVEIGMCTVLGVVVVVRATVVLAPVPVV